MQALDPRPVSIDRVCECLAEAIAVQPVVAGRRIRRAEHGPSLRMLRPEDVAIRRGEAGQIDAPSRPQASRAKSRAPLSPRAPRAPATRGPLVGRAPGLIRPVFGENCPCGKYKMKEETASIDNGRDLVLRRGALEEKLLLDIPARGQVEPP
jgi:hypothetical protein